MSLYQSVPFSKAPLTNADKAARSVSFGSEQPDRPHTVQREVGDLRSDVERAVLALESRDALPQLYVASGSIGEDAGGTNSLVLYGANLLAGRAKASGTIAGITLTALRPGTPGNDISLAIAVGAGALAVAVVGNAITVTLAAAGSTVANIVTAINAHATASTLVDAAVGTAGTLTTATAATKLSGGTGEGFVVTALSVAGGALVSTALTISETVTNAKVVITDDQLGDLVEGDRVSIVIDSHTVRTQALEFIVVA